MDGRTRRLVSLAGVVMMSAGCAQPFSDLQSARLVGEGQFEVTGHYSSVSFREGGQSDAIQDNWGLQAGLGVRSGTDIRVRYERIDVKDADLATNVLALGPKFRLVEDRFAINLPVGFAFGGDIESAETWEAHPTFLVTKPVSDQFEVNGSGKMLVPLSSSDSDVLLALNFGLGISSDLSRWALRPEFGMLFNPGEDGHFQHVSLGVTLFPGAETD